MKNSILKNKNILAVGTQIDLLRSVKGKIQTTCPECRCDTATTLGNGRQMMLMITYNLIILDMVNTLWNNLVDLAANREFPVLALSDKESLEETMHGSQSAIIRAAVPRENLNIIVPTVEEVLRREKMSGLRRSLEKSWRFMMKLGPGYQYISEKMHNHQGGKSFYIYY